MSIDPVERRLEQSFEAERWTRFIQDCQDLCLLYTSPSPRDRG